MNLSKSFPKAQSSLEKKLKQCSGIVLSEEKQADMKRRIMNAVAVREVVNEPAFTRLIEKIKEIARQLNPRERFRILLREKLLMIAQFQASRRFFLPAWCRTAFARRAFASALAFVFIFTVLFNSTFKIEIAEASFLTSLESVVGQVEVVRNGSVIAGDAGFILKADDVVRTGKASKAVIKFLDQSVSRLDEDTEIKISKLFVNPLNKTETTVEVVLNKGRLWSRVINLINNLSSFQVKVHNALAVAKKKAAFDVSVSSKGKAKVSAVKNKVDLVVATDKKVVETTLVKGFSAEVKKEINTGLPKVALEKPDVSQDKWVKENLVQDQAYIATMKQEIKDQMKDQVKMLPGNPLYAVKELSESTKLVLTLDDFDKKKKIVMVAQEKLAEAEVLLEKGDTARAQSLLEGFQSQVSGVQQWALAFEATHPAQVMELRTTINSMLDGYEKQLAVILPDDPLYALKTAVGNTKISVAAGPVQKTEEKLSQATEKLNEAHDLVEQGNQAGAVQQVHEYKNAISNVVSEVKQMPSDDKEKAVSAIIDTKAEDLKSLEALVSQPETDAASSAASEQKSAVDAAEQLPAGTATPLVQGTSSFAIPGTDTLAIPQEVGGSSTVGFITEQLQPKKAIPEVQEPAGVSGSNAEGTAKPSLAETAELKKTVADAKTETLTQLGEAVLEVQQNKASVPVMQKLQDIKKMDMNGKPLMDITLSRDKVTIKDDGNVISVTPRTTSSKIPESLPAQP